MYQSIVTPALDELSPRERRLVEAQNAFSTGRIDVDEFLALQTQIEADYSTGPTDD